MLIYEHILARKNERMRERKGQRGNNRLEVEIKRGRKRYKKNTKVRERNKDIKCEY